MLTLLEAQKLLEREDVKAGRIFIEIPDHLFKRFCTRDIYGIEMVLP